MFGFSFFPFHGWIKVDKSHLVFYQYMPSASQQEEKKSVIFALRDFCRFKNITHKGRHHYNTIFLVIYIYLYILQPEPVLLYVVLMNQSILQPNLFKALFKKQQAAKDHQNKPDFGSTSSGRLAKRVQKTQKNWHGWRRSGWKTCRISRFVLGDV